MTPKESVVSALSFNFPHGFDLGCGAASAAPAFLISMPHALISLFALTYFLFQFSQKSKITTLLGSVI
jgi:hypothetical protein